MKSILTSPKACKQKYLCFILFAFLFTGSYCSSVFALEHLGAPLTNLQQYEGQIELEYTKSKMDLLLTSGKYIEYSGSTTAGSGRTAEITIGDFETTSYSAKLGYCFSPDWEAFMLLSGVEGEFGDSSEKFESDLKPSFGGGLKTTFYQDSKIKIGALIQGKWSSYHGQLTSPLFNMPQFVEFDIKEAQIALGASYLLDNDISVYGGPFYHYMQGDFEYTYIAEDITTDEFTTVANWGIEADSSYGGYIGAQWDFYEKSAVNIEYQFTSSASVLGAGISYKY